MGHPSFVTGTEGNDQENGVFISADELTKMEPMLTEEQRARVCVVLVRARNPNNIGAVARAMHGFGFTDLRIVNEYSVSLERARSAVDASAIPAESRAFAKVQEAVADCSLVVGTTAVGAAITGSAGAGVGISGGGT